LGIPRHPSDSLWFGFRGGVNEVIYPEETLKITKLIQQGEPRRDQPGSEPSYTFKPFTFSCELSCEGTAIKTVEESVREIS
jgi:hypothetical protein